MVGPSQLVPGVGCAVQRLEAEGWTALLCGSLAVCCPVLTASDGGHALPGPCMGACENKACSGARQPLTWIVLGNEMNCLQNVLTCSRACLPTL